MTTALRSPVLVDLQHALAAEIGIGHQSPAARRLLDLLTIVVARSYSLACRADARYQILNGDVQRVWRASERLACQEAHAAARVVTQSAFSDEAKTAAGIELASFVTEVLKIQVGAIPNSIGHTSKPAELARIVQYDYFIGATQELLSERWNRPTITSARAYIRSALTREAHRHYVGKLQEQRLLDSIEPLRVPIPTEFRADHVVVPIDLEHGLACAARCRDARRSGHADRRALPSGISVPAISVWTRRRRRSWAGARGGCNKCRRRCTVPGDRGFRHGSRPAATVHEKSWKIVSAARAKIFP